MTGGLTSGFKLHHLINHVTLVQSYMFNFRAFGKHLRNQLIGWLQTFVWAVESKQKHRWNLNTGAEVNVLSLRANFESRFEYSAQSHSHLQLVADSWITHDAWCSKETCPRSCQIHSGHKAWVQGFPAAGKHLSSTTHASSVSCLKWPRSVRPCLSSLILKTPALESSLHSSIYFSPPHFFVCLWYKAEKKNHSGDPEMNYM